MRGYKRRKKHKQQTAGEQQREAMSIITPRDTITITIDNMTRQASMSTNRDLPIPHLCLVFLQLCSQLMGQMIQGAAAQGLGLSAFGAAPGPDQTQSKNEGANGGTNGDQKPQ